VLAAAERARVINAANELRFAETPPACIVPALADEGTYIASESSFRHVLDQAQFCNKTAVKAPSITVLKFSIRRGLHHHLWGVIEGP
jgi:putative transposase